MSLPLTASTITDPRLEVLLAELDRLRKALTLHMPTAREADGTSVCRACAATAWPCPTARAAFPVAGVIYGQSPPSSAAPVISRQSLQEG
ncbi:hypothetical protein ABZ605_27630 [Streptomyces sp. NPDC012765]|uniref:hypothetical protein n=1 Tax=Streptomyces sp. NPDC012765 TaxID=3155249 RepID=UPI0033E4B5BC